MDVACLGGLLVQTPKYDCFTVRKTWKF